MDRFGNGEGFAAGNGGGGGGRIMDKCGARITHTGVVQREGRACQAAERVFGSITDSLEESGTRLAADLIADRTASFWTNQDLSEYHAPSIIVVENLAARPP